MEIPVKKNNKYIVDIIDYGYEGEGIAKIDGFTIFVDGALKDEKCEILIVKVTSSYAYGKIEKIINKSKYREEPDCLTYKRCGGCDLRHIQYEETLNIKTKIVQNLINKELRSKLQVNNTLGMGNPYHYRNKAQYPVGINKSGDISVGVFAKRTHEIIQMKECFIQNPVAEKIAFAIYKFIKAKNIPVYDEKSRTGILRHIVIKIGVRTHEIMCILVINGKNIPFENEMVDLLVKEYNVKTIVKNINTKNTNVILGHDNIIIHGDGYIYDILGDFTFKISPMSFYQTNPIQTEALYNIAVEEACLDKNDIVYDLYCGIGTIGIFASQFVKKVYGIEIVEDAIKDAEENAKLNNIQNIDFICGDVEKVFENVMKEKCDYPDVVFVDPPRKGLDRNTIDNLLAVKPKKIVYISCNPASMVRDLKLMEEEFDVNEIQPVDMFPFTSHVECCAVMTLKDNL